MPSKIADYLPELVLFFQQLTDDVQSNKIASWNEFASIVRAFYTPSMMEEIEAIAPGWIEMASHGEGITLIHVTAVFVALMQSTDYQTATTQQRTLMEWATLFHDITKVPLRGGHDYVHPYKSASVAGKALINLNFPTNATQHDIDSWYDLTYNATLYSEAHSETIQDSEKLPQIIEDLGIIHNDDASAIVLAILLHFSITTHPQYPSLAPMSEAHMKSYITTHNFPIIRAMMLADGNAWHLFDEDTIADKQRRDYAHNVFDKIAELLNLYTKPA